MDCCSAASGGSSNSGGSADSGGSSASTGSSVPSTSDSCIDDNGFSVRCGTYTYGNIFIWSRPRGG